MITFTKVKLPFGWLGNMSPCTINHMGGIWKSSEALFQAMRFTDADIREEIRAAASPMTAKMIAKKHRSEMAIQPLGVIDLDNMRLCIFLKFTQNADLQKLLLETGNETIIEDVTNRRNNGNHQFWGAKLEDGVWVGQNTLGKMLMELRDELRKKPSLNLQSD